MLGSVPFKITCITPGRPLSCMQTTRGLPDRSCEQVYRTLPHSTGLPSTAVYRVDGRGFTPQAGNHLSPVAEVGLLRPPRRRQRAARGQASRAPCATGGAIWGTAAWGQLIGTLSTAGGHGAGSYKDLGGSGKLRRCGKPPLWTRFLGGHAWPSRKQRRYSRVPGRSGHCPGCRGGKQCTK